MLFFICAICISTAYTYHCQYAIKACFYLCQFDQLLRSNLKTSFAMCSCLALHSNYCISSMSVCWAWPIDTAPFPSLPWIFSPFERRGKRRHERGHNYQWLLPIQCFILVDACESIYEELSFPTLGQSLVIAAAVFSPQLMRRQLLMAHDLVAPPLTLRFFFRGVLWIIIASYSNIIRHF